LIAERQPSDQLAHHPKSTRRARTDRRTSRAGIHILAPVRRRTSVPRCGRRVAPFCRKKLSRQPTTTTLRRRLTVGNFSASRFLRGCRPLPPGKSRSAGPLDPFAPAHSRLLRGRLCWGARPLGPPAAHRACWPSSLRCFAVVAAAIPTRVVTAVALDVPRTTNYRAGCVLAVGMHRAALRACKRAVTLRWFRSSGGRWGIATHLRSRWRGRRSDFRCRRGKAGRVRIAAALRPYSALTVLAFLSRSALNFVGTIARSRHRALAAPPRAGGRPTSCRRRRPGSSRAGGSHTSRDAYGRRAALQLFGLGDDLRGLRLASQRRRRGAPRAHSTHLRRIAHTAPPLLQSRACSCPRPHRGA